MAEKRKIQGEVEVTSNAGKVFGEIADSSRKMAETIKQSGNVIDKSVSGIGTSAEKGAAETKRAYGRIEAEIRRVTAAMQAQAEGTGRAGEILNKAVSQGLDASKIDPMLQKLRDLEVRQKNVGISAGQMANSLRQVPAQFTDIFVSLASGQNLMTVMLQQGGQIKDMFGGVGAALKAVGGYALSLVNPFTIASAAVGGLAFAYYKGAEESKKMANSIIFTNNAIGTNTSKLYEIATGVSAATGATKGAVNDVLTQLVTTGNVASKNLGVVSQAALAMSKATGASVGDLVKQFNELGKSPVEASLKLNEQYHYLTASVYEQIKALQDQGKTAEAAALAQKTFADASARMANEVKQSLGGIESAWNSVKSGAKSAWDAMLGIGREKSFSEQIGAIEKRIYSLKSVQNSGLFAGFGNDRALDSLQKQLDFLKNNRDVQSSITTEEEKQQKLDAAKITFSQLQDKYLDRQAQKEKEIAVIRNSATAAGISDQKIINGLIAQVEDKYKDKKEQISDYAKLTASIKEHISALNIEAATGEKATASDKLRVQIVEQLATGQIKLSTAERASVTALLERMSLQEKVVAQAKDEATWKEKLVKFNDDQTKSIVSSTESLKKEVAGIREHTSQIGKSKDEIDRIQAARYDDTIAIKEHELALAGENGVVNEYTIALREQIQLLKDRRTALLDQGNVQQMHDIAKKIEEEWKKTSEKIGDSITDALMRGFESGKSFAENLRDTVVNMFKTMVLRPAIQATVVGGLSAIGMGSSNAFASDSSGVGNYLGLGNSAYGALSGNSLFGGMYTNFATSGLGSSLGLSTQVVGSTGVEAVGSMTSLGSSIGAALPWIAGAAAVLSMIDFGGGTPHKGGIAFSGPSGTSTPNTIPGIASAYGGADAALYGQFWEKDWTNRFQSSIADALKEPASGIASLLNTTAKTFNQQSGYTVGLAFSADGDDSSRGRLGILDAAGNEIAELIGKYSSDASAGMTEFLSATGAETRKALDAMDLPEWADGLLAALGDTPSLENLSAVVSQINSIAAAAEQLAPALGVTTDKFAELYTTLGLDALNTYYTNFYSEAERTAQATETLTKQISELGFALPESRDAFRALIESQDLTTESGMEAYSALVQLSGAFAALVPSAETASETMRSLQEATESLQIELLKAQGDLVGAAEAQRAVDTSAMSEAEIAIYDYNAALREQINTLNAASAAASARLESQADRIDTYLTAQREAQSALAEQALSDQKKSLNEQVNSARTIADEFSRIAESLADFRTSLLTGESSPLDPEAQYRYARSVFEQTANKAALGDAAAAGNLQSAINEFLSASKVASRDQASYASDFNSALSAIDSVIGTASRQSTIAEQSLQVAQAQLSALEGIASSLSVSSIEASLPTIVDNFTQAMLDWESWFANTLIGQTDTYVGLGATTRISDTKGIFTDTAGNSYVFSQDSGPYGLADQSKAWAEEMLRRYGQWKVPGYATGGEFSGGLRVVGEQGPELELTGPSRIVSNADMSNIFDLSPLLNKVSALIHEVSVLRSASESTARNTHSIRKLNERWDADGMPDVRDVA